MLLEILATSEDASSGAGDPYTGSQQRSVAEKLHLYGQSAQAGIWRILGCLLYLGSESSVKQTGGRSHLSRYPRHPVL